MSRKETTKNLWFGLLRNQAKKMSETIVISLRPPSSLDLDLLDYVIWDILENKMNTTSHPNIGLLKSATEEEMK